MSCRNRLLGSFFTFTASLLLTGCGGSGDTQTVAQNTAPAAAPSAQTTQPSAPEEPYSQGYGSEGSSGGGYGADSGGGDGMSSDGYDSGGDGYGSGGMMSGYGNEEEGSGMMGPGYGDGYGDGYDPNGGDMAGMSGPGMGDGYGGYGGGGMANSNINQMTQFIGQNCVNCHGPRQTKGDVRLDGLTGNFADKANADLWKQAMQQLETGAMPPKNAPSRPNPSQTQAVVSFVKQALDANGMLEDEDYLSQAKYAFGIGKEKEAIELLYAYAITSDEEQANTIFQKSRWFALGPRPTTTLRFAVGAILEAPSTLTDIKPIGASQMGGGGGAGGSGYGGEGSSFGRPGGAADNAARERSFRSLSGSFGAALVSAFESRWSAGKLGGVFNEVVSIEPRQPQFGSQGGFGGPDGGRSMGGMSSGGIDGGFGGGDGYEGGYDGGYGGGGFGGQAGTLGNAKEIMPGMAITPGLVYLGTGSQAELLEKARAQGIDGLFVFDIKALQNRLNGMINNDTRLFLLQVDGKSLGATKTLKNTEIERAKLRGIDGDEVQKNIDRLFVLFDEKFALAPMPALKPEHAKNRLLQLLTAREALPEDEEASMNLAVLFETRMFHSLGLVSQEDMATVYQIVLEGNEGESLAVGTADDRKLVLEELVPTI